MTDQAALVHDPLAAGLYRHLITFDAINHNQWLRACAEHATVGECRRCGGHLSPRHPDQRGHRFDYEAACIGCGQTYTAPGGRVLRRSSAHNEMPGGWWDQRMHALKNSTGGAS